ncbi:MAG: HSP20 family protein [Verrucomicrobiales bacterium]|jgi:HSP20 family protein
MNITESLEKKPAVCEQKTAPPVYQPVVDIYRTDTAIHLNAELPGVDEATLSVDLDNDVLTLKGETDASLYTGDGQRHEEFHPGRYHRSFRLGQQVDREGIKATIRNGLLHLQLPLKPEKQRRKITIDTAE